jgi:predicted outer membrane repeat protein
VFENNQATNGDGGAIWATANISRSVFKNNSASAGGGAVRCNGDPMTITDSYFEGNASGSQGGGALMLQLAGAGTNQVLNSTFFNNSTASASGGGIHSLSPVNVVNSTFLANSTIAGGFGGALRVEANSSVESSTFISNSADSNGGAIYVDAGQTLTIEQSILSGNTMGGVPNNCDCPGTCTSLGYNLTDAGGACEAAVGTDLLLGTINLDATLQDRGGYVPVLGPLAGSSALNAVPAGVCAQVLDARGIARPQGGACDIGAVESNY